MAPTLPVAMEIHQEIYRFDMAPAQNIAFETFVISGSPPHQSINPNNSRTTLNPSSIACHLAMVHFQKNSSTLSPKDANTILSVLKKCKITQVMPLVITGYTCELGPDQFNQILSLRRARTVANLLRNHGFTVATVQGKGAQNPISRHPQELFKNRRVELEIHL